MKKRMIRNKRIVRSFSLNRSSKNSRSRLRSCRSCSSRIKGRLNSIII